MSNSEKILIGTLLGIAVINFYLQHKAGQKLDEIKNVIKSNQDALSNLTQTQLSK
jgi:hypothetical protein